MIEIENLDYIYNENGPFEKKVLNNINLKFKDGEFIGLIGHTGSGKSTLVQQINGILKPTSGRVIINGKDINLSKKPTEIRKNVGLVFQYPEHQLFEETVFKDIAFGPRNLGLEEKEVIESVKWSMEKVGIDYETFKEKSPFELSGGQKRRVAIAGVLSMKPNILILDEPTAGLDPIGRKQIFSQLRNIKKENPRITIILISHSMNEIVEMADRIVVINNGEIKLNGVPEEVFKNNEKIEKYGLEIPDIVKIMERLKTKYPDINTNIFSIDNAVKEIMNCLRRNKDD